MCKSILWTLSIFSRIVSTFRYLSRPSLSKKFKVSSHLGTSISFRPVNEQMNHLMFNIWGCLWRPQTPEALQVQSAGLFGVRNLRIVEDSGFNEIEPKSCITSVFMLQTIATLITADIYNRSRSKIFGLKSIFDFNYF